MPNTTRVRCATLSFGASPHLQFCFDPHLSLIRSSRSLIRWPENVVRPEWTYWDRKPAGHAVDEARGAAMATSSSVEAIYWRLLAWGCFSVSRPHSWMKPSDDVEKQR